MSDLSSTDRVHAHLGKRGAFEGVARRHGRRRNPARRPPPSSLRTLTNQPRHSTQRWVEKCDRSVANSETPHSSEAGLVATFDAPGQAIRCANAIRTAPTGPRNEPRAGVHTGEVELRGDAIGGLSVDITAAITALAKPGEILVSRTVTDLVIGSGITFAERGIHVLSGIPEPWSLFAVTAV